MYAFLFSENEIEKLASVLLETYPLHKIFLFEGDLGAGKTSFIKAICKTMGSQESVSSPTFSLVNEYAVDNHKMLYHMDLYRIENPDELEDIGFQDYLDSQHYCFIEWPEIAAAYFEHHIHISIEILSHGYRKFTFQEKTHFS